MYDVDGVPDDVYGYFVCYDYDVYFDGRDGVADDVLSNLFGKPGYDNFVFDDSSTTTLCLTTPVRQLRVRHRRVRHLGEQFLRRLRLGRYVFTANFVF